MSPEMEALLEWAKVVLGFIGPVMVVVVTTKMSQSQKLREEKEAQAKKEQEAREAKFTEALEILTKKVDRIDSDLSSVKSTVEEMEKMDAKVHSDLAMLNKYHEINVKHVQKVSGVVCTIGEGLRDNNIDGKMTSAVSELRSYEANMYTELFGNSHLASDEK